MLCRTNNITPNIPYIQTECGKYFMEYLSILHNIDMDFNNVMLLAFLKKKKIITIHLQGKNNHETTHLLLIISSTPSLQKYCFIHTRFVP